jgi:hypothetical protein
MIQLSATRCSCIAILWLSLVSFAAIALCVASQQVLLLSSSSSSSISLSTESGNFWRQPRISLSIFCMKKSVKKLYPEKRHVIYLMYQCFVQATVFEGTSNIWLTNWMEQSLSWELDSYSASEETPHLLWNLKVHCHVHKRLPLVLFMSHMNLVHTFPSYLNKIHSNIILPSTHRSSEWPLTFRFSDQNFCMCISSVLYMLDAPHISSCLT